MSVSSPNGANPASAPRRTPLGRARRQFVTDPSSTRNAIVLIVVADLAAILIGGTIIWLLDRQEYEHLTEAFWYTLQTITTVGYGDVTPVEPIGRLVGAVIMLLGIAFLSILTATITSSFIDARGAARRSEEASAERAAEAHLDARLGALLDRFDQLEELVRRNGGADA
jgi:voltage-gated potassium channel